MHLFIDAFFCSFIFGFGSVGPPSNSSSETIGFNGVIKAKMSYKKVKLSAFVAVNY